MFISTQHYCAISFGLLKILNLDPARPRSSNGTVDYGRSWPGASPVQSHRQQSWWLSLKLENSANLSILGKNDSKVPEFKIPSSVELKVPSLAKVTEPDGEIFDDLDDNDDFGARVASKEKTDHVRKTQIMDLNKQNQWKSLLSKNQSQFIISVLFHTLHQPVFAKYNIIVNLRPILRLLIKKVFWVLYSFIYRQ